MDSPSYSDSDEESTCSSGSSSIDSAPKPVSVRPTSTDLGKRVVFTSGQDKKLKTGILRYLGEPEFSEGLWCGVVLDVPRGKNNGSIHGIRYFTCEPNYGVFVPVDKVEVDTNSRRSRSRPNSQPGSRASSVERKAGSSRPSSASKPVNSSAGLSVSSSSSSLGPASKLGLSMQHDLVNRLAQPMKRHAQSHSQSSQSTGVISGRRLPMKAFATKGTEEISVKENKKPLMPFRPGGMYKASSSENLRSMKGKEKVGNNPSSGKINQGMPAKKSSSERDLRKAGKSSSSSSKVAISSPSSVHKPKRKPMRNNSCSDLLAPEGTKTDYSSSGSNLTSSRKISCDYAWSRTSTPGNRDELTPDGCSSPDETDDTLSTKAPPHGRESHNNGFLECPKDASPPIRKAGVLREGGLSTHAKQFAESEISSPSLAHRSAQSPERMHGRQHYTNKLSGSATLPHPLAGSLVTDGKQLLKQLVGSNTTTVRPFVCCLIRSIYLGLFVCACAVGRRVCGKFGGSL